MNKLKKVFGVVAVLTVIVGVAVFIYKKIRKVDSYDTSLDDFDGYFGDDEDDEEGKDFFTDFAEDDEDYDEVNESFDDSYEDDMDFIEDEADLVFPCKDTVADVDWTPEMFTEMIGVEPLDALIEMADSNEFKDMDLDELEALPLNELAVKYKEYKKAIE